MAVQAMSGHHAPSREFRELAGNGRSADAQMIEYLEPRPRDADKTITRLIAVLDTQELARAIDRLEKSQGYEW